MRGADGAGRAVGAIGRGALSAPWNWQGRSAGPWRGACRLADRTRGLAARAEVARDWRVLYLAVVWMLTASAVFGIMFWAPLLIASMFGDGGAAATSDDGIASDGGKICSQGVPQGACVLGAVMFG